MHASSGAAKLCLHSSAHKAGVRVRNGLLYLIVRGGCQAGPRCTFKGIDGSEKVSTAPSMALCCNITC
jgi:hypothetical protein